MTRATRRKLAAFAKELEADGRLTIPSGLQLRPGTRLVREWRGRTHTVAVLDDGFGYDGKTHASLTMIAEAITGAHWSGPRFFGLTGHKTAAPSSRATADPDRTVGSSGSERAAAGGAHG